MAKIFTPLHMLVTDKEDVLVLSSLFQDAVAKIGDMAWLPAQRRFALVANRFVWERGINKNFGPFQRVQSGMHFDDVRAVKTQNIRLDAPKAVVDLLALRFVAAEDGAGKIFFDFAGGGSILLDVESINGEMRDMSNPWRTNAKPRHKID